MDNFLEKYNLPKLTPVEIETLNRPITTEEIEKVIKDLPYKKAPGSNGFTEELYQTFNDQILSILLKSREKEEKIQVI